MSYGKIGPMGGSGGARWENFIGGWPIRQIRVRSGAVVDSLQVAFDHGPDKWHPRNGGPDGDEQYLELADDEGICLVEGKVGHFATFYVVSGLRIRTTKGQVLEAGNLAGGEKYFGVGFPADSGMNITGFFGTAGKYLDSLGVYISMSPGLPLHAPLAWGPVGGSGGEFQETPKQRIQRITMYEIEKEHIDEFPRAYFGLSGMTVVFEGGGSMRFGTTGTRAFDFDVPPDDPIVSVRGYYLAHQWPFYPNEIIHSIGFRLQSGQRSALVGQSFNPTPGSIPFDFETPLSPLTSKRLPITGFLARSGGAIDALTIRIGD